MFWSSSCVGIIVENVEDVEIGTEDLGVDNRE